MRLHRFIINDSLHAGKMDLTSADVVHQMKHVLRLGEGDRVLLSDGRGAQAEATVLEILPQKISLEVAQIKTVEQKKRTVVLYQAMLKRENFEWVVQKAVEVGVSEIVPLITARTVKLGFKLDRLQKIAKEAAEQCGRADVVLIREPMRFADAVQDATVHSQNFFFDTTVTAQPQMNSAKKSVGVWIGPEGGWTSEEIDAAQHAAFQRCTLGPLTLRAETAAVIASYLIVHG